MTRYRQSLITEILLYMSDIDKDKAAVIDPILPYMSLPYTLPYFKIDQLHIAMQRRLSHILI